MADIRYLTTLAGWVHYLLTGKKVLGVGDASGIMPIDTETCDYNSAMVQAFDNLVASYHFPWKLKQILPAVLSAGANAGSLTSEGAVLLDPSGDLNPGCISLGIGTSPNLSDENAHLKNGTDLPPKGPYRS